MEKEKNDSACCVCLELTEQRGGKSLYSSGCCGCWLHLECAYSLARSSSCSKKCPLCRAQITLPYVPSVIGKRSREDDRREERVSRRAIMEQQRITNLQQRLLRRQAAINVSDAATSFGTLRQHSPPTMRHLPSLLGQPPSISVDALLPPAAAPTTAVATEQSANQPEEGTSFWETVLGLEIPGRTSSTRAPVDATRNSAAYVSVAYAPAPPFHASRAPAVSFETSTGRGPGGRRNDDRPPPSINWDHLYEAESARFLRASMGRGRPHDETERSRSSSHFAPSPTLPASASGGRWEPVNDPTLRDGHDSLLDLNLEGDMFDALFGFQGGEATDRELELSPLDWIASSVEPAWVPTSPVSAVTRSRQHLHFEGAEPATAAMTERDVFTAAPEPMPDARDTLRYSAERGALLQQPSFEPRAPTAHTGLAAAVGNNTTEDALGSAPAVGRLERQQNITFFAGSPVLRSSRVRDDEFEESWF
jgi:hypothetical protein